MEIPVHCSARLPTGNVLPAGAQRVKLEGVADAVQEPVTGPLLLVVAQSKVMGKSPVNWRVICTQPFWQRSAGGALNCTVGTGFQTTGTKRLRSVQLAFHCGTPLLVGAANAAI